MKEMFDQATKTMEQTWDMWQRMMEKGPWWQEPQALDLARWRAWVSAMRSAYEINVRSWKIFLKHGEETFFLMFKRSPMWNEAAEAQMRSIWDGLDKALETQEEAVKQQWERMESLVKGAE